MSQILRKDGYYDISFHMVINGQRRHFHKRKVSKSKKEAKRIEQEYRDKLNGKIKILTLYELYDLRNSKLEKGGKSAGTYRTYDSLMKLHIKPFLINKEISKYQEIDFSRLIDTLQEKGRTNATINKVIMLLKAIFNFARKNGYLAGVNPLDNIESLKTVKRSKPYYFNHEEFLEFIEVVKRIEDDPNLWETIWTILFELGLRKSELEPLQVKDISFEHRTISIRKHLIEGHGNIEVAPGRKNGEGYDAPMSKKVEELIKQRIANIENYDGYSKEAYLLSATGVFSPLPRTTLKNHLDAACKAGGYLNTTPHAFRHMCCLNLVELGADVFTIANHIGDTVELVEKVYGGRIKSHTFARNLLDEQNEGVINNGK